MARRATRRSSATSPACSGCTRGTGTWATSAGGSSPVSAALDDARLPADAEFRAALRAYMEWAVDDVLAYSPVDAVVPEGRAVPHWSWDGLEPT